MHATPAHAAPMQPHTHTHNPHACTRACQAAPAPHPCHTRAHPGLRTPHAPRRPPPAASVPTPMSPSRWGDGAPRPLSAVLQPLPRCRVPGGPQGRALRVGQLPSPTAGCQIPPPTQEAVGALSALCTRARPARGMRASEEGLEERNQVSPEPPASPWHAAAGSFEEAGRGSGPGDVPSGAHGMRLAGARSLEEPPRPRCGVSPKQGAPASPGVRRGWG